MRTTIICFILIIILLFAAIESGMFETRQVTVRRNGIDYMETEYEVHWDKFFDYILKIPREINRIIRAKFFSTFEVGWILRNK